MCQPLSRQAQSISYFTKWYVRSSHSKELNENTTPPKIHFMGGGRRWHFHWDVDDAKMGIWINSSYSRAYAGLWSRCKTERDIQRRDIKTCFCLCLHFFNMGVLAVCTFPPSWKGLVGAVTLAAAATVTTVVRTGQPCRPQLTSSSERFDFGHVTLHF